MSLCYRAAMRLSKPLTATAALVLTGLVLTGCSGGYAPSNDTSGAVPLSEAQRVTFNVYSTDGANAQVSKINYSIKGNEYGYGDKSDARLPFSEESMVAASVVFFQPDTILLNVTTGDSESEVFCEIYVNNTLVSKESVTGAGEDLTCIGLPDKS